MSKDNRALKATSSPLPSPQASAPASETAHETPEPYLSAKEAAAFLGVTRAFIYKWQASIPHVRMGGPKSGKCGYLASELRAWAESQRVVSSPQ